MSEPVPKTQGDIDVESPSHSDDEQTDNESQINKNESITIEEKEAHHKRHGKLSFHKAVIILTTWSTSGAVVAIPWAFGQLGYVLGPCLLIATVGFILLFNTFLLDVADSTSAATATFGDIGHHLGGKFGRTVFVGFQITNLVFYMPVALETIGVSIEYISHGDCLGYWNIITFGGLYLFVQVMQCWEHVSWIGYITVSMVVAKALGFLPYSYVEYQDDIRNSSDYDYETALPFGNPSPTWYDISTAIATLFYSFAPIFVLMEVRNDMKEPRECKRALSVSAILQVVIYIVAGVTCVALWGYDVADPITLQIPYSWVGYLLNIFVVVAVCLDYAISAKVVNDLFRNKCFPDTWTTHPKLWQQLLYTLPTAVFSLVVPLAVPNFSTLIGLLTGITIIGTQSWMISLAWEWGGRKYEGNKFWMRSGAILGASIMIFVIAGAMYNVITADYSPGFFCSGT
mmetsp:Transcript_14147/g.34040  ORF Transcript_14147/g.34040 Transcript_14147/m.34040 type:complete len:457 (-) Transcript_14147:9-1379(-)